MQQTSENRGEQSNAFVTKDEFEREMKKQRKDVDATLTTFKKDLTNDLSKELGRQLDSFRESVVDSTKKATESVAEGLLAKINVSNTKSSPGKRSVDGRPICNGCHKVGHIERACLPINLAVSVVSLVMWSVIVLPSRELRAIQIKHL